MPMRQRLKRRFGKDHERPIVMKPKSDNWKKNFDLIDWSKDTKEVYNESISSSNRSSNGTGQA